MNICFLGGMRYSQPLDATSEKKFRALATLGEMRVIGFSINLRPRSFTQHGHFYLLPCLPVATLRYLIFYLTAPFLALWSIFRHGATILVAQSPYEGVAAALAKITARLVGRRVALIVESHGDFEISLFMECPISLVPVYRIIMRLAARFSLDRADVLRPVSNSTRDQLGAWAPNKPSFLFPAWTDIDAFLEAGAHPKTSGDTIMYTGVLIPRKGVHFLLEAFDRVQQEFPAAVLWIVGKAQNPDYAARLKQQARKLGLNGRVIFRDHLPQRQLAEYMAKAEVFVLPSESEGLGRVVFEAMAAGIPVIGSEVGGIPEMVENGITGFLVPPKDVTGLAEKLRWILAHPEEARQMGRRGRESARRFFSTAQYVQNYARLFQLGSLFIGETEKNYASPLV